MARPVEVRIVPDQPLSDIDRNSANAGEETIKLPKPCSFEMAGEDKDTSNEDKDTSSLEREEREPSPKGGTSPISRPCRLTYWYLGVGM